jgi:hypothetical protein
LLVLVLEKIARLLLAVLKDERRPDKRRIHKKIVDERRIHERRIQERKPTKFSGMI